MPGEAEKIQAGFNVGSSNFEVNEVAREIKCDGVCVFPRSVNKTKKQRGRTTKEKNWTSQFFDLLCLFIRKKQVNRQDIVGGAITTTLNVDSVVSRLRTLLGASTADIECRKKEKFIWNIEVVHSLSASSSCSQIPQPSQRADRKALLGEIFSADNSIARHAAAFVGREFVKCAVDKFLLDQSSGYFVAIGEPGIGKSAFMANYVNETSCVAHFNSQSTGINLTSQYLRSVAAQIILGFELPYAELPKDVDQNGAFLTRLLNEASSRLEPGGRLVIAVDALDEVDRRSQSTCANTLYLPPFLPPGVFFLITSRERESIGVFDSPVQHFRFRDHPIDCEKDAATYIQNVAESRLLGWLLKHKLPLAGFTDKLLESSASNFMYLKHILSDIAAGGYEDQDLNTLPRGLEAYYDNHWKRMGMDAAPLPEDKIHVIYCLARQPSAWPRRLIARAAGLKELRVQEILNEWREFLRVDVHDHEDCYSIYHKSFYDFLHRHDIVEAAGASFDRIDDDLLRPLLEDFELDEDSKDGNFDGANSR